MKPPALWRMLTRVWHVPDQLSRVWFQAVAASTYSEVCQWRQTLFLYETYGDPARLLQTVWTPPACCHTLDLLATERRLSRQMASRIQEVLLHSVRPDGQWNMVKSADPLTPEQETTYV